MSQAALLDADQVQPAAADSVVVPEPPLAATAADVPLRLYVHPAACVTVNATPPIVTVPLRATPVLAANEYASVPEPDALLPAVSHAALLVGFHTQSACVVMPIDPVPAVAATLAADGANAYVQLVPPCADARKFAIVSAFWL